MFRLHSSFTSRSTCEYHKQINACFTPETGMGSVSEALNAPAVRPSPLTRVVQIMANSMPVAGDGGASHTSSYDMSGLTLSDMPQQIAEYMVLGTARQMRDYRLPDTEIFWGIAKNFVKRRFIVEDRFL